MDRDRDQEHEAGHDELPLHVDAEEKHPVVDTADDQATEDPVERLAPAAEEAGAADDPPRNAKEDELTTVDVVRHPAEIRGVEKAADARRERGENEAPGHDPPHLDAGPPGRLTIASDGIHVAPEFRLPEEHRIN